MEDAGRRWAQDLAAWAVPPEILARAAVSPWAFHAGRFRRRAEAAATRRTPADVRAREALAGGGTVLDVGCGAGAASVPLVPPATAVAGVDTSAAMLRAFREVLSGRGVRVETVEGPWNDVAADVGTADVVVCHDVLYNEPDAGTFLAALTAHARRRVIVVVPAEHPQAWTAPYWRAVHGLERPGRPVGEDLVAVAAGLGEDVHVERSTEATGWAQADPDELVDTLRRRLCLPPARDDDLRALLARYGAPAQRRTLALWWEPAG